MDNSQVVLFGSVGGNWREDHVIPLLDELGVSYFNPVVDNWTPDMAQREAEAMKSCETVLIVINGETPSFSGVAESGWAAFGAFQRKQTFIFCVLSDEYKKPIPFYLRPIPFVRELVRHYEHSANSLRHLMVEHAKNFNIESMFIVDKIDDLLTVLRKQYGHPIEKD